MEVWTDTTVLHTFRAPVNRCAVTSREIVAHSCLAQSRPVISYSTDSRYRELVERDAKLTGSIRQIGEWNTIQIQQKQRNYGVPLEISMDEVPLIQSIELHPTPNSFLFAELPTQRYYHESQSQVARRVESR